MNKQATISSPRSLNPSKTLNFHDIQTRPILEKHTSFHPDFEHSSFQFQQNQPFSVQNSQQQTQPLNSNFTYLDEKFNSDVTTTAFCDGPCSESSSGHVCHLEKEKQKEVPNKKESVNELLSKRKSRKGTSQGGSLLE